MKKIVLLTTMAVTFLAIASCKTTNTEPGAAPQEWLEQSYGSHIQQRFDVYLPANRHSNTKVILFLHGGGFIAGDKSEFTSQCKALVAKGFAVINANYRLVDTTGLLATPPLHRPSAITINDQLADIKTLIELIITKATDWQVSREKIATAGHSAGGTLALLAAYNNKDKVKAAANWAGLTNFSFEDESWFATIPPFLAEAFYRIVGHETKNQNKLAFMAVSPIWVVISGKHTATINIRPEFNLIFGMPDESKKEYQDFTNALNSKGTINTLVEIKGADHGFGQAGNWEEVVHLTANFFNKEIQ